MAACAQEYITPEGRVITNSVEGFHGLALKYRSKRVDLQHVHYTCKTNMAICHKVIIMYILTSAYLPQHNMFTSKNIGPLWKAVCLWKMGVDVPQQAITTVLQEHMAWEKQISKRSTPEYHKYKDNLLYIHYLYNTAIVNM